MFRHPLEQCPSSSGIVYVVVHSVRLWTFPRLVPVEIGSSLASQMAAVVMLVSAGSSVRGLATEPVVAGSGSAVEARTGYYVHPAFLAHDTGRGHPERAERLVAIETTLKRSGLWQQLRLITPGPASFEMLRRVHTPEYIEQARREILSGRLELSTGDTAISPASWEAATLAAGAVCDAVDAVLDGKLRNAFCAVRPPGHHARPTGGMGFCIFNHVAIGARHALQRADVRRVLIVDWDVHHGNGTQEAFWDEPAVMQFHVHQRGIYPGTGSERERGGGAAVGHIMNFPLAQGSEGQAVERLFLQRLVPAAREFRPDLVLVSAGYDAHKDDPIGSLALTADDFGRLTRCVLNLADEICHGRTVFVLEGGYDLVALGDSAAATIREMLVVSRDDRTRSGSGN